MRLLPFVFLLATAPAAIAQSISAEIGTAGLAATESRLASLSAPSDADRFALGGVRFLRAVEGALQLRWKSGLSEQLSMLPFLRLPIPENPDAGPLDPATVATLFTNVSTGMDSARAPLADIAPAADFGVEITLSDLWFDINANSVRDDGEDLISVAGPMILGFAWDMRDPATPSPTIRFDAADAAWLSAYTHLLGGLSDVVLAYDPTLPITRVKDARTAMLTFGQLTPDPFFGMGGGASLDAVDYISIFLATLNQTPDKTRAASAHSHFLSMVADNRRFWAEVALETDNEKEWLPNDNQKSALGVELPPGTGPMWLEVLSDFEALLTGEKLVPYWRITGPAGVDVGQMFTDPRPIDLISWVQGEGAVPYLKTGDLISPQNWQAFEQTMSGQAMLFTLFLN